MTCNVPNSCDSLSIQKGVERARGRTLFRLPWRLLQGLDMSMKQQEYSMDVFVHDIMVS